MAYGYWSAYVPAASRRKKAERAGAALKKSGRAVSPIKIDGLKISRTFWGKAWCANLESYSDYASRLPRGRTYVRNGSVIHLEVGSGTIEAIVCGSDTYTVKLGIRKLAPARWTKLVDACAGGVTSLVELLAGKLSASVMTLVTDKKSGLFPEPTEITLSCSCPDWASMCKHVAAAMYGVGARLDAQPELLFRLRGVDPAELLAKSVGRAAVTAARPRAKGLADAALGDIFGIEMEDTESTAPVNSVPMKRSASTPKRTSAKKVPMKKIATAPPATKKKQAKK